MSVVSVDLPANAVADALLEDGYVIVERLAPDLTDRALAELSADIAAAPTGHTDFLGDRTKRLGGLLRRSAAAREMAVHPVVMALARTWDSSTATSNLSRPRPRLHRRCP